MKRPVQILAAPSILGLRPSGVEHLPESLIKAGLIDKIGAIETIVEVGTLNAAYSRERDPETNCLNTTAVRTFSIGLMDEVTRQINEPVFPLVLGGDCSILIGILPALKAKGKFGLVFLDAHADFYQPEASVTGELADMDLAIVTGRGPEIITNINDLKPFVEDVNVFHIGQRDAEETKQYGSQDIANTSINLFDLSVLKAAGVECVIADTIARLDILQLDGFWIHFDTDVISDEENPAVDYRLPDGLSFDEAGHILRRLIQTGKAAGMSVTIFNPSLDKEGRIAAKVVDCLAYAFLASLHT